MTLPPGLHHHDPVFDDVAARHDRLCEDRDRLFTTRENISIDVIDIARDELVKSEVTPTTYTEASAFELCLQRPQPEASSRFYILKPSHPRIISRCKLHISEDLTRKMLAQHRVMPSFLDHLHAYGQHTKREQDASFGGGRYKLHFEGNKLAEYELCYTLKFGVANNRKPANDPQAWSIRKSTVYQKFRHTQNDDTWIHVQPSDEVQKRLRHALGTDEISGMQDGPDYNPLKLHLLSISAANAGWRDYYNHLEKIFYDSTSAAVNFAMDREYTVGQQPKDLQDPLKKFPIDFDDVQKLQRLEELLRRVKTALEHNEDSIRSLRTLNEKLRLHNVDNFSMSAWCEIDIETEQQLALVASHKRNFDALLHNVHGRSRLLYNVLEFKNALTVSNSSQRAVDIRTLQANETAMMTMIQEMNAREAIGVKILTLLATLYVPASFVAVCITYCIFILTAQLTCFTDRAQTFLDAGVVTFDADRSTSHHVDFTRMVLSKETLVFYLVFTAILMVLTYGCWWLWSKREGRQVEQRLEFNRKTSWGLEQGLARMNSGMTAPPMSPASSPTSFIAMSPLPMTPPLQRSDLSESTKR